MLCAFVSRGSPRSPPTNPSLSNLESEVKNKDDEGGTGCESPCACAGTCTPLFACLAGGLFKCTTGKFTGRIKEGTKSVSIESTCRSCEALFMLKLTIALSPFLPNELKARPLLAQCASQASEYAKLTKLITRENTGLQWDFGFLPLVVLKCVT